jgi:hypothetical protein
MVGVGTATRERGHDDAVGERESAELDGSEKRFVGHLKKWESVKGQSESEKANPYVKPHANMMA